MTKWILNLGIVSLIISVLSLILSNDKMSKYIKGFLSLLVLILMLQPVLLLKDKDFSIKDMFSGNYDINLQNEYLDYVNQKNIEVKRRGCEEIIHKYDIKSSYIRLFQNEEYNENDKITKAEIFFDKSVINQDSEHIDIIEQIKFEIGKYLNIDPVNVGIYVR